MNTNITTAPNEINISFANNKQLENNTKFKKKHTKFKKHKCNITDCTKRFRYSYQLKDHILMHLGEKNYKCDICNKYFVNRPFLNKHKQIHEDRSFKCNSCDKLFARKSHLQIHKKSAAHIEKERNIIIKKYKCDLCIKTFSSKKEQHKHYRTNHKEYKAFSCTVCNKKYFASGTMKLHYNKTHADEETVKHKKIQSYQCDHCAIIFTHLYKLEKHSKQQHSDKKPYVCNICNTDFVYLSSKVKHNKTIHGITRSSTTVSNKNNQNVYEDNNQQQSLGVTGDNLIDMFYITENDNEDTDEDTNEDIKLPYDLDWISDLDLTGININSTPDYLV